MNHGIKPVSYKMDKIAKQIIPIIQSGTLIIFEKSHHIPATTTMNNEKITLQQNSKIVKIIPMMAPTIYKGRSKMFI
jgi:hypothetical protein